MTDRLYLKTIAEISRLDDEKTSRFIDFITLWSSDKASLSSSYISEWAERFRKGTEYEYADNTRLQYLIEVDGVEYAKKQMRRVGQKNRWGPTQLEREMARFDTVTTSNTVARKSKQSKPFINLKNTIKPSKIMTKKISALGKYPKIKL